MKKKEEEEETEWRPEELLPSTVAAYNVQQ